MRNNIVLLTTCSMSMTRVLSSTITEGQSTSDFLLKGLWYTETGFTYALALRMQFDLA